MFTGIVEEIGKVQGITHKTNLSVLSVCADKICKGTKPGDSIAVDGVCLTVSSIKKGVLTFDIMKETLKKTTLGEVKKGRPLNLERALQLKDRLSGHLVSGHVDDVAVIRDIIEGENYTEVRIGLKKSIVQYIVPKGSVCIDGISLTVGEVKPAYFSVYLIPFTKEVTTLGVRKKGEYVNIETDILAKYVLNNERNR